MAVSIQIDEQVILRDKNGDARQGRVVEILRKHTSTANEDEWVLGKLFFRMQMHDGTIEERPEEGWKLFGSTWEYQDV